MFSPPPPAGTTDSLPKTDRMRIHGTAGASFARKTRVLTAFSSGWTTAVGDVSGDVYRARLGDFRRQRIGASAGAALSERAPAAVRAAVDAKRGRRNCVVRRRVLHEVARSLVLANKLRGPLIRAHRSMGPAARGVATECFRHRAEFCHRRLRRNRLDLAADVGTDRDQFNANEIHC